mmetsp:Transcript_17962/g.24851  ORF Transcript_17962/g.24851 Transcript_17962/m.24851 type:complete len:275 (+) Transcript_17962:108-932(+)
MMATSQLLSTQPFRTYVSYAKRFGSHTKIKQGDRGCLGCVSWMVSEKKAKYSRVSRDVTFQNSKTSKTLTFEMRPISPDDDEREALLLDSISDQSHSLRFFGPKRKMTGKEVKYFTHVDYRDDFALCCVDPATDEIIAVARYFSLSHDPFSPNHDVVEVAVLVADEYSYFGIGTYIMYNLLQYAAVEGKTTAVAEVLKQNMFARKLFDRFVAIFPESGMRYEDDFVEFTLPLVKCGEDTCYEIDQVLPVAYHDLADAHLILAGNRPDIPELAAI